MEQKEKKSFRISSKKLFLTYAQSSGLTPLALFNHLEILLKKFTLLDYVIKEELHQDGLPHLHAYVSCKKRIESRSPRFFDVTLCDAKEEKIIKHPNIESVWSAAHTVAYILKTGKTNAIISPSLETLITEEGDLLNEGEVMERLILNGEIEQALKLYKKNRMVDYLKNHNKLTKSFYSLYNKSLLKKNRYASEEFKPPTSLLDFLNKWNEDRLHSRAKKVAVIVGFSGTGKTSFITSYLDSLNLIPVLVNNIASLNVVRGLGIAEGNAHRYVLIFDDFSWNAVSDSTLKLHREELISFLDCELARSVRILGDSIIVPSGLSRIIISNYPLEMLNPAFCNDPAVSRRMMKFNLGSYSLIEGAFLSEQMISPGFLDTCAKDLEVRYDYKQVDVLYPKKLDDCEWVNPSLEFWRSKNLLPLELEPVIIKMTPNSDL